MFRDLTSGIVPAASLESIESSIRHWNALPGHPYVLLSPDDKFAAKTGSLSQLAAQAGALARLHFHFGVSIPELCLHIGTDTVSEDDCYRYNLPEGDTLLGANPEPKAVLLMTRIPTGPVQEFLMNIKGHGDLIRSLEILEKDMQYFLLALGYIPDKFRLGDAQGTETNISFKEGALQRALQQGSFQREDIICIDPVMGYADLTGFGKRINQLFPMPPER